MRKQHSKLNLEDRETFAILKAKGHSFIIRYQVPYDFMRGS